MQRPLTVAFALTILLGLSFAHAADKAPGKHKLGRQKIGNYTVSVIMVGDPHDTPTVEFDVMLYDLKESKTPPPDPKSLRIWIGGEEVKAEQKTAMAKKKKTFGATVTVPKPLDEKAKVFVEVDTDAGTNRGSFSMEHEHDHKH